MATAADPIEQVKERIEMLSLEAAREEIASGAELIDVREQHEWDDAHLEGAKHVPQAELAGKIDPGKTLAEVRERLRKELERYAENDFETAKRTEALKKLLERVTCDLPEQLVNNEMSGIIREIVQENQGRGVSDEELRAHQDEIIGAAKQSATERVRSTFLLLRIAEKENLKVTEQELAFHVTQLASRYQIPVKKMVKDLQKRNAFGRIREQILAGKALDLIMTNVTVREPAGQAA